MPCNYSNKLSLGKVRNTPDDPAATWCITSAQSSELVQLSRRPGREADRWMAIELEDNGKLTVEWGDKIRLLAFSGTNGRMGGEPKTCRGGFLFGGARLIKLSDLVERD